MAELLADKLSNLHGGEPGTALLMTVAQMQAEDETPPGPTLDQIAMCGPLKVVFNGHLQPRGDDGPTKERS